MIVRLVQSSAGDAVLSEAVFVTAQRPIRFAVQKASGHTSAIVLSRYSVPLASVVYWPDVDEAGHAEKHGNPTTTMF